MEYVYDIVLNFDNYYYDFYEWKTTDKIINIKNDPADHSPIHRLKINLIDRILLMIRKKTLNHLCFSP